MKKEKKPASKKRTALVVVCVVLAVILAALLVVTAYVETLMNRINRDYDDSTLSSDEIDAIHGQEATGTGPTIDENDIDLGDDPATLIGGDGIINIMLIGQDRREGQGRQRSDAMILCTVNTNAKTLTMTSFMRDIYVEIPGYKNNKLNACYMYGGMELLDKVLVENFGVEIDANVEVDFDGFMEIIDMLGGVEIELTSAEAKYLNRRGNWDIGGDEHWSLKEGVNLLNGSQALAYSRIREIGSDFGRTERQRKVLSVLVEKLEGMSLLQVNTLLNKIVTYITTDMTNSEMVGYVMALFPMLTDLEVSTLRIPADKTYSFKNVSGVGDSIIIDFKENRQILLDALAGQSAEEN